MKSDFLPLDEMHEDAADHGRVHKSDLRTARAGTADGIDRSMARRFDLGQAFRHIRCLEGDVMQPGAARRDIAGDGAAVPARSARRIVARLVGFDIRREVLDELEFRIAHCDEGDAHASDKLRRTRVEDVVVSVGSEILRDRLHFAVRLLAFVDAAEPVDKGGLGGVVVGRSDAKVIDPLDEVGR